MKRIRILFLALAVTAVAVGHASAQNLLLNPNETAAWGLKAPCFNAIDSTITDGTIVMVDTTAASGTNYQRFVVRPYNGTVLNRTKCVGVALGNIRRSSSGGNGTVLLWGYHPNVKMAASGIAVNTMVKVGALHGAFATCPDSLMGQVGWFLGYNSRSTAAASRGKVFITRQLAVQITAL